MKGPHTKPLFEVRQVDKRYYEERLKDFLPQRIIDIHTHVWLDAYRAKKNEAPSRVVTWPARVTLDNPVEDLRETYHLMFPDKVVIPLIFGFALEYGDDIEGMNAYVSECGQKYGYPACIFADPRWSSTEFEEKVKGGGFLGAKVYLTMADSYIPEKEMRIFDYLPHHQLDVLNRHGWMVMLHIPRDERLRDPVNQAQMLEIEERYPRVKVIIAHIGRAYCQEDVGDAFSVLAKTKNMMFDFSANTNADNMAQLIRAVGPKRIVFGSDMPIVRMRMRRICENGVYINIVPKGLYGDVSEDIHMREADGEEAERLTFFMYEELDAFRRAAEETGLTRGDIEDIFFNNAHAMIERINVSADRVAADRQQLRMVWPKDKLNSDVSWSLPEGYFLRNYREGDKEPYIELMRLAGFTNWGEEHFRAVLNQALPRGIFFVIHEQSGEIVVTAFAAHNPLPGHPFGGELGWVGGDPAHKGRGLGYIVCAAVTKRLLEVGYDNIFIRTDDERLPALKTYLKLGWVPYLFAEDMEARWRKVCEKLEIDFNNIPKVAK